MNRSTPFSVTFLVMMADVPLEAIVVIFKETEGWMIPKQM